MNAILKMTWVEFKLLLRNPTATFFTLPFPVLLLVFFGVINGNTSSTALGGHGMLDLLIPGYLAIVIGVVSLFNLPIALVARREQGILRRFRATPIPPLTLLIAQAIVNLILGCISAILLIVVGRVIFNAQLPQEPIALAIAFLFSASSFLALGFLVASLARTPNEANAVANILYFGMIFLSGATLPRLLFPDWLKTVTDFLPMTHIVNLFGSLWFGKSWDVTALVVAGVMLIAGVAISARTFRWE